MPVMDAIIYKPSIDYGGAIYSHLHAQYYPGHIRYKICFDYNVLLRGYTILNILQVMMHI